VDNFDFQAAKWPSYSYLVSVKPKCQRHRICRQGNGDENWRSSWFLKENRMLKAKRHVS